MYLETISNSNHEKIMWLTRDVGSFVNVTQSFGILKTKLLIQIIACSRPCFSAIYKHLTKMHHLCRKLCLSHLNSVTYLRFCRIWFIRFFFSMFCHTLVYEINIKVQINTQNSRNSSKLNKCHNPLKKTVINWSIF